MNPKWYQIGIGELGTEEGSGSKNNPAVQKYYNATGLGPSPDSVPWCGAFVAWCMQQASIPYRKQTAARARDWLLWGKDISKLKEIPIGAVGVIARGTPNSGQGHVFMFAGWVDGSDKTKFHALEGNANTVFNDAGQAVGKSEGLVQIGVHSTSSVLGWVWPDGVPVPEEVKPISSSNILKGAGVVAIGGVTEIASNATEVVDAVQKAKSISNGSIVGSIVGVVIVIAVIAVIFFRLKQSSNAKTIQDSPGLKADKPANQ